MSRLGIFAVGAALVVASYGVPSGAARADGAMLCATDVVTGVETCEETLLRAAPGDTPEQLADRQVAEIQSWAAGDVVIGGFWDDTGFTGTAKYYTTSAPCDASTDVDWSLGNVGSAVNDTWRSGKGYAQCQVKVFENQAFGGASLGWFGSDNNFGVLNAQVTSVKWR